MQLVKLIMIISTLDQPGEGIFIPSTTETGAPLLSPPNYAPGFGFRNRGGEPNVRDRDKEPGLRDRDSYPIYSHYLFNHHVGEIETHSRSGAKSICFIHLKKLERKSLLIRLIEQRQRQRHHLAKHSFLLESLIKFFMMIVIVVQFPMIEREIMRFVKGSKKRERDYELGGTTSSKGGCIEGSESMTRSRVPFEEYVPGSVKAVPPHPLSLFQHPLSRLAASHPLPSPLPSVTSHYNFLYTYS